MSQRLTTNQLQLDRYSEANASSLGDSRITASRYGLALDAIQNEKPFAVDAASKYFTTFADSFDEFAVQEPANGLLDAKVLAAIELYRPYFDEFRDVLRAIAEHSESDRFAEGLIAFLGAVLVRKRPVDKKQLQAYLWSDGYRFILRELFLTTIATLLRLQEYNLVRELLEARYYGGLQNGDGSSFVAFDGYAKTLDEFRNRRLQLHRLSVSTDLIRERLDPSSCSFSDLMQADFVLCLRSLICGKDFFARWYPRSLVFAENYAMTGFDLFVTGADAARFGPLQTLLGVAALDELVARFDYVNEAWQLQGWEQAGLPLDFHGFMAQRNPLLAN